MIGRSSEPGRARCAREAGSPPCRAIVRRREPAAGRQTGRRCLTLRPSCSSTTRIPSRSSSRTRSNATVFASCRRATASRRSGCSATSAIDLVVLDLMLPKRRRARGLQAAARGQQRSDHHADGSRRGARQGARARARRGRLHHEAVLDPRVPEPGAGAPAPGRRRPRRAREAEIDRVAASCGSTPLGGR